MSSRVVILDGVRTPFCKAGGALKSVPADDLATIAVNELLARTGIARDRIDEVVLGNVAQPPHAANIARVVALKAGLPESVIAHTVHRNCASGMQSMTDAAMLIQSGRADLVLAGGTESMSQIPLLFGSRMTELFMALLRARSVRRKVAALARFRPSFLKPTVALQLGLTDPVCGMNMGQTAEVLANEFAVTRAEQDAFAFESHRKAVEAQRDGRFAGEIVPVIGPPAYKKAQIDDDGPDAELSPELLAKRRPYFARPAGTVTVGNACPLTDGAVAVLMCSEKFAKSLDIEPLGSLTAWSYAALDGARMGLGPTYAAARLADEASMSMADFDLVEINEAFAAQVVANLRAFASRTFAREHLDRADALGELDPDRVNVNGGAIALGHPVGASGTRLVVTLLRELRRRNLKRGLATLCVGGGQGAALALEAA
jgi:acetyl-CoA C-acetyltransferase/acetyl-CoA acyltransferase